MLESRDRLVKDRSGEPYGDSGQGFVIRRGGFFNAPGLRNGDSGQGFMIQRGGFFNSPGLSSGRGRNLYRSWLDDKENMTPGSSRFSQPRVGKRNSPLPPWHPRSPLRDITAILNALERRRARQRAISQLGRRNQETEDSSPSPFQPNPLTPEPRVLEPTPPIQDPPPSAIPENLTATLENSPLPKISSLIGRDAATNKFFEFPADPTIATENSLLPCPTPSVDSTSIDELPSDTPAKTESSLIRYPIDAEKKLSEALSEAIDEIERVAKARIKRMSAEKKKKKNTRRGKVVLSMR